MGKSDLAEMLDLLLNESVGLILGLNACICLEKGLIQKDIARDFFESCVRLYMKDRSIKTKELIGIFEDVAAEAIYGDGMKKYLFKCARGKIDFANDEMLSNIVDLYVVLMHFVDCRKISKGHKNVRIFSNKNSFFLESIVNKLNDEEDIYKRELLGGNRKKPFFWMTRSSNIDNVKDSPDEIRDSLGLVHYKKGFCLVEIKIKSSLLNKSMVDDIDIKRPTFLEGMGFTRFKSLSSSESGNNKISRFGCAVDLKKFLCGYDNIDGFDEIVVSPVELNGSLKPKFNFIGWTLYTRSQAKGENGDEEFIKKICEDYGYKYAPGLNKDIKNKIMNIIDNDNT